MNGFNLIGQSIIDEIVRKKEITERYFFIGMNKVKNRLRAEANKHSASLEVEVYDTKSSQGRREKARELKRSIANLEKASEFGVREYNGEVDKDFLLRIGGLIEPEINSVGFRNEKVRVSGALRSPPSPEKVNREINYFIFENSLVDNPLEKAVHTHFNLARIHPFTDGNGRTARLIQNIILEDAGFLPINLKNFERMDYNHLLNDAINSYYNAEGNLREREYADLRTLNDGFENDNFVPINSFYVGRVLDIAKARFTPELRKFYNFLALKERDVYQSESERAYKNGKPKDSQ